MKVTMENLIYGQIQAERSAAKVSSDLTDIFSTIISSANKRVSSLPRIR